MSKTTLLQDYLWKDFEYIKRFRNSRDGYSYRMRVGGQDVVFKTAAKLTSYRSFQNLCAEYLKRWFNLAPFGWKEQWNLIVTHLLEAAEDEAEPAGVTQ